MGDSKNSVVVLGVDPGLAHFGWSLVRLAHDEQPCVLDGGVIVTEKSDARRKVLSADDNVRRAQQLARGIDAVMGRAQLVCAESWSPPRNASSAAKLALSWGVLVAYANAHGLPLLQASPQEVKKAVTGSKASSKLEVEVALMQLLKWTSATGFPAVKKADREHVFDSVAAVIACRHAELMVAFMGAKPVS